MVEMAFYERVLRPLLFRIDAERVHHLGLWMIAHGLVHARLLKDQRLIRVVFGQQFPNPLGLAAGFDKDGIAAHRWAGLGFGFAELGTVTWHSQPGNPRPRLFRLSQEEALINRMGFNNAGVKALVKKLKGKDFAIPIGINLGKSRIASLEKAAEDYAASFSALQGVGTYFVLNVSSPNTPGLRELQEKEALRAIVQAIQQHNHERKPLLVKVSPDLSCEALEDLLMLAEEEALAGFVATNTTTSRDGLRQYPGQEGGLSGAPLRDRANEVLRFLAQNRRGDQVLIGVGGIFTGEHLYEKLQIGATLCQAYTGFAYRGWGFAPLVLTEFLIKMDREGV